MKNISNIRLSIILLIFTLSIVLSACKQEYPNLIQTDSGTIPRDLTEFTLSTDNFPSDDVLTQLTQLAKIDARNVQLSVEQYEHLKQVVPQATILWNVPFQNESLPENTQELTPMTLSQEDIFMLHYFPELRLVDLGEISSFEVVDELQRCYPDIDVQYHLSINDKLYSHNTESLQLEGTDIDALSTVLPYLPQLKQVSFVGDKMDYEAIYQLMISYPEVSFQFDLELFGLTLPNNSTCLDFSGISMKDTTELESFLKFFPYLERVEMCDCGIPSEEMDALSKRYPHIKFVWTIKIRNGTLRTDAISFIPYKLGYDIDNPISDIDCKELKYCTDLICMDLGHMKIRDISFLEYMPNMQYLVLVDMPCRDFSVLEHLNELVYLEIFNVRFTELEVLLDMTKLEDLNISYTPTSDIDVIRQLTWLKRLWATHTRLNSTQIEDLRAALPNTQVVTNARHSTDMGWRDNDNYREMRDLLGMFYME